MELASNYYRTRAHYSTALKYKQYSEGREGEALCSTEAMPVVVFDAAAQEYHERKYLLTPKPVGSLPLCKKCERAAKKAAAA